MSLKPTINVEQSFPSCSTIKFSDTTGPYNGDRTSPLYNPGGYGTPNPAITSITSTKISILAPGTPDWKVLELTFLPTMGSITFNTNDLAILEIPADPNPCHTCPPPPPCDTPALLSMFSDGCWGFKYEVFSTGNQAVYNLSTAAFPSYEISMFIDGVGYYFFNIQSVYYLSLALNNLNLGIWTLKGTALTVTGFHTYGTLTTDAGDIAPSVVSDQILVGSVIQSFFFSCNVSNAVIQDLMSAYAGNNSCDDAQLTEMLFDISLCYQTMLIASVVESCGCDCVNEYLSTLNLKIVRYNDYLKNCSGGR